MKIISVCDGGWAGNVHSRRILRQVEDDQAPRERVLISHGICPSCQQAMAREQDAQPGPQMRILR